MRTSGAKASASASPAAVAADLRAASRSTARLNETGIGWIGSSFYFIWLDNSLDPPPADSEAAKKGVAGELWAVHGGGFYNPQKYAVAPASLPEKLHWFKWEAYTTWLS